MKEEGFIHSLIITLVVTFLITALSIYLVKVKPSIPLITPTPTQTGSDQKSANGCKVTGCSSQICSDKDVLTTCEILPKYGCYKNERCERQKDGKCDWTQTDNLQACLKNHTL